MERFVSLCEWPTGGSPQSWAGDSLSEWTAPGCCIQSSGEPPKMGRNLLKSVVVCGRGVVVGLQARFCKIAAAPKSMLASFLVSGHFLTGKLVAVRRQPTSRAEKAFGQQQAKGLTARRCRGFR